MASRARGDRPDPNPSDNSALPALSESHQPTSADEVTFPTLTTRIFPSRELPDEYQTTSPTGLVPVTNAQLVRTATVLSETRGQPPPPVPPGDVELVTWLPNDPENPHSWGRGYRWYGFLLYYTLRHVSAERSHAVGG
jgi:hypothetical protein